MTIKKLNFVAPNDPILLKRAQEISVNEIVSDEINDLIEQMLTVAYGEQQERSKPVLVGLAGPQVGVSRRIILVDIGADGHGGVSNLKIYINPQIIHYSNEKNDWYEGCFSTDRVCGIVNRPNSITLQAFNEHGEKIEEKYSGYVARIFQHEVDHLDGKVFVDHISEDNNLHWVEKNEFPQYRDKEAWRTWPKKCSREKWEKIKAS